MSNNNFPYKTFGGWVRSLGLRQSDLTADELADAREEYEARKRGDHILDGLESIAPILKLRRENNTPYEDVEILDGGKVASI